MGNICWERLGGISLMGKGKDRETEMIGGAIWGHYPGLLHPVTATYCY